MLSKYLSTLQFALDYVLPEYRLVTAAYQAKEVYVSCPLLTAGDSFCSGCPAGTYANYTGTMRGPDGDSTHCGG